MRKTILFIAMSLDGYIADYKGNVDWLAGENPGMNDMQSYDEFIKGIDTVIMGWNTYHQIHTELFVDQWPYSSLTSYIITHRKKEDTNNIHFIQDDQINFIYDLKQKEGKDIWICGGAQIVHQCLKAQLIDRLHISIIPTLLGKGIKLFQENDKELKLTLIDTIHYNGIVDLIYEPRRL